MAKANRKHTTKLSVSSNTRKPRNRRSAIRSREETSKARPSTPPDPIFAKIEAHRNAKKSYEAACCYEDDFPHEITRFPRVQYGMYNDLKGNRTPYYLRSEKEIRYEVNRYRTINGESKFARGKRKALRQKLLAEFRADAVALKKAQDKAGYTAAQKAYHVASVAEHRAYDALLRSMPKTAAGMAALAEYVAENERTWLECEKENACFKALKLIAVWAQRMASELN